MNVFNQSYGHYHFGSIVIMTRLTGEWEQENLSEADLDFLIITMEIPTIWIYLGIKLTEI